MLSIHRHGNLGHRGTWWGENDDALSIRTISEAMEHGILWFDTAPVYGIGHSEEVVGKALKGKRDKVLLSTKCGLEWDYETPCFHKVMEGRKASAKIWRTACAACRQIILISTTPTGSLRTSPSILWKRP